MATKVDTVRRRSWDNLYKGLVLGAFVGSLFGLSASISLVLISGSSLRFALEILAMFATMMVAIAGFIGFLVDLDQFERTRDG